MICVICGDDRNLSKPFRYWSPDDGYRYGRMCPSCKEDFGRTKPKPTDFAYSTRTTITDGEFESAIDMMG